MILAFTDLQLDQLRSTAATLPAELRTDLVRLVAGFMSVEGETTDGAFGRALSHALDALHHDKGGCCACAR